MYWAQELAKQTEDKFLQKRFSSLAKILTENEKAIVGEMADVQGKPADIGGYYLANPKRSEEHTSELQSLMRISYAVFCLKKKNTNTDYETANINNSKDQQHQRNRK